MNRALRRSLGDFSRHPWLHLVSISTICLALLLIGTFFIVYRNMSALADKTRGQNSGTIFLKEQLPEADIARLRERVLSLSGVKSIAFKNKHQVMDELQSFINSAPADRLPSTELFPDVLEIELRKEATGSEVSEVRASIATMPEVAEVDFSEDWILQFQKIRHLFRVIGFVLAAGVIVGCGFIIANFMGIRHQSRRAEIEIVRLHGAHHLFILAPFLWEGFIEGIIGASASIILLFLAKSALTTLLSSQWLSLLGMKDMLFLSTVEGLAVMLIGIAMAFFGSITVFLRFREQSSK